MISGSSEKLRHHDAEMISQWDCLTETSFNLINKLMSFSFKWGAQTQCPD